MAHRRKKKLEDRMEEIYGKDGEGYALFGKTDKWSGRITTVFPEEDLHLLKNDMKKPKFVKHDYYPAWKYKNVKIKKVKFVKGKGWKVKEHKVM